MRRYVGVAFLALIAVMALVPMAASAAPRLSFQEAGHEPGVDVYASDERATYLVRLKNTGDAPTSGTTTVAFDFPGGVRFGVGEGSNWTCSPSASICTSPEAVTPGNPFSLLTVYAWFLPGEAPNPIAANFVALGGGDPSQVIAQDTLPILPAKPFEITGLQAASCAEPSAAANPSLCSTKLGSDEYTTAGGHPYAAVNTLSLSTRRAALQPSPGIYAGMLPIENLRDGYFELPAGFIGNLQAVPGICTYAQLKESQCPASAVVGALDVETEGEDVTKYAPLYRIFAEDGYVAAFGVRPAGFSSNLTYVLRVKLRANGDYGVTAIAPLPPQVPALIGVGRAELCSFGAKLIDPNTFDACKKGGEVGANPIPFLTNPTRCAGELPKMDVHVDSYEYPGAKDDEGFPDLSDPNWKSKSVSVGAGTGCEALTEAWVGARKPSFGFQSDSDRAAAPAGYTAHVHIPQDGLIDPEGLGTAHLKDTTVTLPEGIALNPSAADGLGSCTSAQAGYLGNEFPPPNRIHFKTTAPGCPLDSKVGVAEVKTPVLANPLPGSVYIAAQEDNPFNSRFAIYLVIDDPKTGIKATLPGRVMPDPVSGRITTVFKDNPQAPVEDVELRFFSGPRASLVNPDVCGDYGVQTQMTPWSALDPDNPAPGEIATPGDVVHVGTAAAGRSSCAGGKAERPFAPTFEAGSDQVFAGAHTPFSLRITRGEGEQELSRVEVTTPPGFAATLKGVAICSDAAVAAAAARAGKAEMANPSCPASSLVGTTTIGAGAGPSPFYVKTGRIYLTGPYRGAPLSFSFVVPAVAGPFDLGVQVVKTALFVNPRTAQVTAESDPIPQILEGVPLQIRDVRVNVDRPGFTLNPSNCEPMQVSGELSGGSGAVANLANRFQVGNCEGLGFRPKLKLELHGSTRRARYQRLEATVTARPGDANIGRAAVTLPHSLFLAQEHIRTICTRVQFAARACPAGSVYGHAEATTPLLDGKLSGPVYLRSSDNELPDLVVALRGPDAQPIEVELAGRNDSIHGGIRNTFEIVPDAPVSKFELELFGGEKSLIITSRNLCQGPKQRATARFTGQNGKRRDFRPVVQNDCGGKGRKRGGKGAEGRHHRRFAISLAALGF